MSEFEVDGQTYRSGKMSARTQFHVLRRMAPIVGPLQAMSASPGAAETLAALVEAIGSLSDEASDYIMDNCLAVVDRKQGETGWAKIKPAGGSAIMFADIDLMAMLQIASHVLRDNFTPLFQRGLASFKGEAGSAP
jgi:hypothetical protein